MLPREAAPKLRALARGFPIVAVTGPRQSGKTTLARAAFPKHEYLSLEDLDVRLAASDDPRGFLESRSEKGFILDEVQHAPDLLSYLQTFVDGRRQLGRVVLTGSQSLLLHERISQSLAGRVGMLELLPFRLREVAATRPEFGLDDWLFHGLYPPLFDRPVSPVDWYPRYVQTYVDRDVRSLRNITDLTRFNRFVRLCAGRIGQLVNFTSLAADCGIDVKTAQSWTSVLEASYVLFTLRPHHRNFSKRLIKQPKLYFVDTGLACSLLDLKDAGQLATHYLRGALYENLVFLELLKERMNRGERANLYFWRDHVGHEVDFVLEESGKLRPFEVKVGQTVTPEAFDGLVYFRKLAGEACAEPFLVHGGNRSERRFEMRSMGWRDLARRANSGALAASSVRRAAQRRTRGSVSRRKP